jgi:hypothetical protein
LVKIIKKIIRKIIRLIIFTKQGLREQETEYANQLLKDIAQKSAGVFLGVALVVSSVARSEF